MGVRWHNQLLMGKTLGVRWHNQHPGQIPAKCSPQQDHPSSRQQTLLLVASIDHMAITPVWCEREWHTSFPGILPSLPLQQTLICFPGSHVTFRTSWFCLATFSEGSAPSAPSLYLWISCSFVLLSSRPQHLSLLSHSLERDPRCLLPGVRNACALSIHYRVYVNVSLHSSE